MSPAKKKTARKTTGSKTTSTTTPKRSSRLGRVLWMVAGGVLLAYLLYGLVLVLFGAPDGLTRIISSVVPYPAAKVVIPGFTGQLIASTVLTILLLVGLLKLFYLIITDNLRRRPRKLMLAVVLTVVGIIGQFVLPSPCAAVISYHEYLSRADALETFQSKQQEQAGGQGQAPDGDELKANALSQLIILNRVVVQEAAKQDVSLSQKEVDDAYQQYVDRLQGEENLKKQLRDFLGWSVRDFRDEIKLKLLQDKLNTKLATDDKVNQDRRQKADEFLARVKDQKQDFATVAKESDDPAAEQGGDQGTVKKGELDPAIESEAFKLNPGEISGVIKTQNGYAIIQLVSKTADTVNIRQILVRTKSLTDILPENLKNAKVTILVRGFAWDKQLTQVKAKSAAKPETPATASPVPVPVTQ